jgi:hypothetical protein
MSATDTAWVLPATLVVITAVLVTVALVVGRPGRRVRAARPAPGVLDHEARTASQLRDAADAAAGRGDFRSAVLDRFRAMVRSLADRTVLEDRPGLTAHEAAVEAGLRFPVLRDDLARAGTLFDQVRYGHADAGADDDAWLRRLDAALSAHRPTPRSPVAAEAGP